MRSVLALFSRVYHTFDHSLFFLFWPLWFSSYDQEELGHLSTEVLHTRHNYTELAAQQQRLEEYMNTARLALGFLRRATDTAASSSSSSAALSSSSSSSSSSSRSSRRGVAGSVPPSIQMVDLKQTQRDERQSLLPSTLPHSLSSARRSNSATLASASAPSPSSSSSVTSPLAHRPSSAASVFAPQQSAARVSELHIEVDYLTGSTPAFEPSATGRQLPLPIASPVTAVDHDADAEADVLDADSPLNAVVSAVRSVLEASGLPTAPGGSDAADPTAWLRGGPASASASSSSTLLGAAPAADLEEGEGAPPRDSFFGFVCGIVETREVAALERMLFRATRGNAVSHFVEVDFAHRSFCARTGRALEQTVALVFYSGGALRRRIERVCDSMECRVYPLPDREAAQDELFRRMEAEYHALSSILDSTHQQRCTQLQYVARRLDVWALRLQRERCVLLAMNQVRCRDESLNNSTQANWQFYLLFF